MRRGKFGVPPYSEGPCATCRKKRHLTYGICLACGQPLKRRALVEAGVPCGSAAALSYLFKNTRGKGMRLFQIQAFLAMVHPILMQNIKVSSDGTFKLENQNYFWMRRSGWCSKSTEK